MLNKLKMVVNKVKIAVSKVKIVIDKSEDCAQQGEQTYIHKIDKQVREHP
jgi:ElaB/YqjD/DUF883 family membrane-anchored ribosome-binding protein